jgi:hypothetical protein
VWLNGDDWALGGEGDVRAHQRLLREFLTEHLTEGRALRAFDVWERGDWLVDRRVEGGERRKAVADAESVAAGPE